MIIDRVDGIARTQASNGSGRASDNFADDRGVGWFTKAIGDGEEYHRQDNIHGNPGDQHYNAFTSRFSGKTLGVVSPIHVVYVPIFSRHSHKTADGQEIEGIDGVIGNL